MRRSPYFPDLRRLAFIGVLTLCVDTQNRKMHDTMCSFVVTITCDSSIAIRLVPETSVDRSSHTGEKIGSTIWIISMK